MFLIGVLLLLLTPAPVFAASNADVSQFSSQALTVLTTLATLACAFFLVRGGLLYMTSTGKPDELDHAKKTIRNALIGLVIVIGAAVFSSVLNNAFTTASPQNAGQTFELKPLTPAEQPEGLTQVLIDAVVGFIRAIVESAAKPVVDAVLGFLTNTPSLAKNSVVFNFWIVTVGIVDSLFVLFIALLGFHVMSASTFGFDELEFKHLLPRIGLAFLGANISIFLIDWIISLCNLLVKAVLDNTGGLDHALALTSVNQFTVLTGAGATTPGGVNLITPIFMLLFVILAVTLLLYYIGRLITLAVGAVLAPFIFLLWLLPGFTDFAIISVRAYLVAIFTVFVHVVIIQLASSFLTIPGQQGISFPIAILVGVATLFSMLRAPGMILQFAFYSAANSAMRKLGGQLINVMTTNKTHTTESKTTSSSRNENTTPRRNVKL